MKTNYKGIDYSAGQPVNRDTKTGIRYGVIPCNACNPDATEEIWSRGDDLDYQDYLDQVKGKLAHALGDFFSDHQHESGKPSRLDQAVADAFEAISDRLGDQYEGTGDCTRMRLEESGLTVQTDSSGDLWVFESEYFTY